MNNAKAVVGRAVYFSAMLLFMVGYCHAQFQNKLDRSFKKGRCPEGYVCGFGEDERSIEKAKERARSNLAKNITTEVQAETKITVTEDNFNPIENLKNIETYKTSFTASNIDLREIKTKENIYKAVAFKRYKDVVDDIIGINKDNYEKASSSLNRAINKERKFDRKIRELFKAYSYNKMQIQYRNNGRPLHTDIYEEIENEVLSLVESLIYKVTAPDINLNFNREDYEKIKIELSGDNQVVVKDFSIKATLHEGLLSGWTSKSRDFDSDGDLVTIELGKVQSTANIFISTEINLPLYDPYNIDVEPKASQAFRPLFMRLYKNRSNESIIQVNKKINIFLDLQSIGNNSPRQQNKIRKHLEDLFGQSNKRQDDFRVNTEFMLRERSSYKMKLIDVTGTQSDMEGKFVIYDELGKELESLSLELSLDNLNEINQEINSLLIGMNKSKISIKLQDSVSDPINVMINDKVVGQTDRFGRFESQPLNHGLYFVKISNQNESIVEQEESILLESNMQMDFEVKKKYGFLSFIPIDKTDQVIEVDFEGEKEYSGILGGKINQASLKFKFGKVIGGSQSEIIQSTEDNIVKLPSDNYTIRLIKQGFQTTALSNRDISINGREINVDLFIEEKNIYNGKLWEFVPFYKPFICNESTISKFVKTGILGLLIQQSLSTYLKKQDAVESYNKSFIEYESLYDVDASVMALKRNEMSSSYSKYEDLNSSLTGLLIGTGLFYGLSVTFTF